MNADSATKPRMMPIKNLAKNGPVGVLKPRCKTPSDRTAPLGNLPAAEYADRATRRPTPRAPRPILLHAEPLRAQIAYPWMSQGAPVTGLAYPLTTSQLDAAAPRQATGSTMHVWGSRAEAKHVSSERCRFFFQKQECRNRYNDGQS